jgi:anti-sigma factor RsiW
LGVLANAYFDDELEPAEREWFEKHLLSCPECALDLEAFRTIQRLVRSIQHEGDPFDRSSPLKDSTYN